MYASLADINTHLPADKAQISVGEDDNLQIDAQRLIRSRLAGTFTNAIIALWVDPENTPEMLRQIAGKLIAAKFYANLVAEDDAAGSVFAQNLYNEAIASLNDIRSGVVIVVDDDGLPIDTSSLSQTSFWPNATTQEPSFTVAETWS